MKTQDMFETGVCHSCNGQFEYPIAQSGQEVECRYCGKPTVLYRAPRLSRARRECRRKSNAPAIIGAVTGVAMVVVAVAFQMFVGIGSNEEGFALAMGGILLLGVAGFTIANR